MDDLASRLKSEALRLGFHKVGIASALPSDDFGHLADWLDRGDHAGMDYMRRQREARADPASILEGVRSIILVSLVYGGGETHSPIKVARYAQRVDYHEVLWSKLELLLNWLKGERPAVRGRAVADTAPLLERDFARRAGLGWIGKNTMLIDRKLGSYTVLGALLVDIELKVDAPHDTSHCGTCTRCLDACPTNAFRGPFQLDARKCISYWTIEHKGDFPDEVAAGLDGWVFGCDVCQEVCPWNRKALAHTLPEFETRDDLAHPDPRHWLTAEPTFFSRSLKGTALARAKRKGLLRNLLSVLGTREAREYEPEIEALIDDPEPIIARAARWALARIRGTSAADSTRSTDFSVGNETEPGPAISTGPGSA